MTRQALRASGNIWFGKNARALRALLLGVAMAGSASALVACSSNEVENDGSVRGTLTVYIATMEDGTSRTEYHLLVQGSETDERMLVFSQPPSVATGSELKVWGDASGSEIIVQRFEVVSSESADGLGTSQEAIVGGSQYPTRNFAYVLVDLGGGIQDSRGMPYSKEQAQTDVFGMGMSDGSTRQWFLENSYGRQDISGAVVGPVSGTMASCGTGRDGDTSLLANGLRAQVNAALPGVTIDHYLWYFGTRVSACGWAGLASVGTPQSPSKDTWYNRSSGCTVLVQEPAHNFGLQHSSGLRCSGATMADDPGDCEHLEYGDCHDPMGGGCRHTNAWQKAYQGWFGGCNRIEVGASGTFNLVPTEVACDGIQVLQIPMPAGRNRAMTRSGGGGGTTTEPLTHYYLEYRTKTGFDASMTNAPTVLVHVGGDFLARSARGVHTWILDMNPATVPTGQADNFNCSSTAIINAWDGLGANQTFMDPAGGVSFTVTAMDATHATVNVTVPGSGSNTCTDGGTLATPSGPTSCGNAGAGGAAGTGGAGGRGGAGAGGRGGIGGMAGAGGGMAGSGGTGGAANTGGAAGSGLTGGGSGGITVGGAAGVATAGTTSLSGSAGAISTAGASGTPAGGASAGSVLAAPLPGEIETGCGCRVVKAPRENQAALLFGLLVVAGGALRRRRTRT